MRRRLSSIGGHAPRRASWLIVLCVAAASGCKDDSTGHDIVARVGGTPIYSAQLDRVVEEARAEAEREDADFPDDGSDAFRRRRHALLERLVLDVEISKMAQRLGVAVPAAAVFERAQEDADEGGGREEGADETSRDEDSAEAHAEEAFARSRVRARLLYEAVARKVTADVKVTRTDVERYYEAHRAQLMAEGRSPARARLIAATTLLRLRQTDMMRRWVERVQQRFRPIVHYSDGY